MRFSPTETEKNLSKPLLSRIATNPGLLTRIFDFEVCRKEKLASSPEIQDLLCRLPTLLENKLFIDWSYNFCTQVRDYAFEKNGHCWKLKPEFESWLASLIGTNPVSLLAKQLKKNEQYILDQLFIGYLGQLLMDEGTLSFPASNFAMTDAAHIQIQFLNSQLVFINKIFQNLTLSTIENLKNTSKLHEIEKKLSSVIDELETKYPALKNSMSPERTGQIGDFYEALNSIYTDVLELITQGNTAIGSEKIISKIYDLPRVEENNQSEKTNSLLFKPVKYENFKEELLKTAQVRIIKTQYSQ